MHLVSKLITTHTHKNIQMRTAQTYEPCDLAFFLDHLPTYNQLNNPPPKQKHDTHPTITHHLIEIHKMRPSKVTKLEGGAMDREGVGMTG